MRKTKTVKSSFALIAFLFFLAIASYTILKFKIFADQASGKNIKISSGFNLFDANTIKAIGLEKIKSSGFILFSFNDQSTGFENWSIYGPDCKSIETNKNLKCFDTITLTSSLSYYIYNPNKEDIVDIDHTIRVTERGKALNAGWHIISWNDQTVTASEFMKKISITDTHGKMQTLDYAKDKKIISSEMYEIVKESDKITHRQLGLIDSDSFTSKIKDKDGVWIYIYPGNNGLASFAPTGEIKTTFSYGLNRSPLEINKVSADKIDFYQDITNLSVGIIRYINADLYTKTRASDLATAKKIKATGAKLMANLLPQGDIQPSRNSEILSSKGKKYETADEILYDINLYSGISPDGASVAQSPQWEKLKTLLIEQYFKSIVIPRVSLYKDTVEYWQPWNEPDGKIGATSWAIAPEALALLTTGQVKTPSGPVSFGTNKITGLDGKKYDISRGTASVVKQICPNCKIVSAGFYRNVETYFTTLRSNNYMDYVDANDIHLNLQPYYAMNYTRYWGNLDGYNKLYDWLCGDHTKCAKPLYSTEIGSPGGSKYIDTKNDKPTGFTMTFSNNFQADDLIKRFVSLSAKGLKSINWNGYFDSHGAGYNGRTCPTAISPSGFYEITSPNSLCNHTLKGLYSTSSDGLHVKKPSYSAYKVAASLLGFASKIDILSQGNAEKTDVDPIFLFKITDFDGKQKYSAWCEPFWNVSSTDPEKKAWNYEDRTCSKTLDLTQYGLKGLATITTRDGNTLIQDASKIKVSQSPIFIEY